jgi:hypothetical protein
VKTEVVVTIAQKTPRTAPKGPTAGLVEPWSEAPVVPGGSDRVGPRSVAWLISLAPAGARPSVP